MRVECALDASGANVPAPAEDVLNENPSLVALGNKIRWPFNLTGQRPHAADPQKSFHFVAEFSFFGINFGPFWGQEKTIKSDFKKSGTTRRTIDSGLGSKRYPSFSKKR